MQTKLGQATASSASFVAGYVFRLTLALIAVIVWFFLSGTLSDYVEFLRDYPMKWLNSLTRWIILDLWNPVVGKEFPSVRLGDAPVRNMSALLVDGKMLLLPSIMFVLVLVEAIFSKKK